MQTCPFPERCAQFSQTEADYNRLFNLSLDLLCIAGLDGYFKRVNPSWTRVLGWSEEELLARPVEFFMHPEDRERTLQARAKLAQGVPVRGLENRYLCKDGSFRWLSWQSTTEPSGTTVFAIARDITERRQLEQERIILSKLESTGVLAGGIAHDFNNLLAALMLNIEYVSLCGATSPQQDEHLRRARQSILAAQSLTQQLITFAEGGVPARRLMHVGDVLKQATEDALRGSTLRSECTVDPALWPADLDEGQIAQVLRNIILNAREASADNGVVRARAENVVLTTPLGVDRPAGEYVRITIEDDGVGVPPEILPNIFDPYFSTKRRGTQKGMGLGLTICRAVVDKHGGTIAVDSRPGQGTKVTLHLPARRAQNENTTPTSRTDAGRPRILVMDDEPLLREALGHMLDRLGYEVELAENGDTAVALYDQAARDGRPFAIVLLDLTVRGGMGGSETLNVLRARDRTVRAVLMTGYANNTAFRSYAELGFRAALAKPFQLTTLRTVLADILTLDTTCPPDPGRS